jgi:hypothetical protein
MLRWPNQRFLDIAGIVIRFHNPIFLLPVPGFGNDTTGWPFSLPCQYVREDEVVDKKMFIPKETEPTEITRPRLRYQVIFLSMAI